MALSLAQWAALSPQITYWVTCAFFETLIYFNLFSQYRVFLPETKPKNIVSKFVVLRYMICNHLLTSLFLLLVVDQIPSNPFSALPTFATLFEGTLIEKHSMSKKWAPQLVRIAYLASRQFIALVVVDSWQFWCHFTMHKVTWLYREFSPPFFSGFHCLMGR